jgi:hypothetical protein
MSNNESYYACGFGRKFRSGRRIELKYPSDAVPMIAEYLDGRYEVCGLLENETVDETDEDRWTKVPMGFRHRDYDNRTGYVQLVDDWGETVAEVAVVCEEYDIYWSWVQRWAEELFELHFLPLFEHYHLEPPYFEWDWKGNKPGMAARVWSRETLLKVYRQRADCIGGTWSRRYAKLLSDFLEEKLEQQKRKMNLLEVEDERNTDRANRSVTAV